VMAADPVVAYMTKDELTKQVKKVQNDMEKAAKELDFIAAARLRDEMLGLKKMIAEKV
jgi:excinuclease ABC subunit B